jgi:hypothetical protein
MPGWAGELQTNSPAPNGFFYGMGFAHKVDLRLLPQRRFVTAGFIRQ